MEMLISRLTDRPLRPMLPKGWAVETQVLTWLMSYDGQHQPEPLAITSAGAALAISGETYPPFPTFTPHSGHHLALMGCVIAHDPWGIVGGVSHPFIAHLGISWAQVDLSQACGFEDNLPPK